jgi:glyoxylase I family protein
MNAFNHIAFRCRDIAKEEAFYTKHFGFKRSRTFNKGTPGEFFMLKLGSIRLELFPPDAGKPIAAKSADDSHGFLHLAIEVPKLEPVIAALTADGIECGNIIDCSKHIPGLHICFFHDPEGNRVELMQGYKDEE